jgi:hypothetical protein
VRKTWAGGEIAQYGACRDAASGIILMQICNLSGGTRGNADLNKKSRRGRQQANDGSDE